MADKARTIPVDWLERIAMNYEDFSPRFRGDVTIILEMWEREQHAEGGLVE